MYYYLICTHIYICLQWIFLCFFFSNSYFLKLLFLGDFIGWFIMELIERFWIELYIVNKDSIVLLDNNPSIYSFPLLLRITMWRWNFLHHELLLIGYSQEGGKLCHCKAMCKSFWETAAFISFVVFDSHFLSCIFICIIFTSLSIKKI